MRLPETSSNVRKQVGDYSAAVLSMVKETVVTGLCSKCKDSKHCYYCCVSKSRFKVSADQGGWIPVTGSTKAFHEKQRTVICTKGICVITRTETKADNK